MDLQELIEQFRIEADDSVLPYLWSDDELLRYIVASQDTLVKKTGGIADVTVAAADVGSPVTRLQDLAVTTGQPYSALSPYILRVRSGRLLVAREDVAFVSEGDMDKVQVRDYGFSRGMSFDDTDSGPVTLAVLGVRDGYVRLFRVPASDDTCRLHVYRLPYPRIEDQQDSLEVLEHHHIHLVKGMKSMAYLKEDAETYDKDLAAENKAAFAEYCEDARKELEKRRFKPRVVTYAGP